MSEQATDPHGPDRGTEPVGLTRTAKRALQRAVQRTIGELPLRNRWLQGTSFPNAERRRRYEIAETRRQQERLGTRPKALVATVIPTFNRPELLAMAVQSALAQTVEDNVVIVVSDGAPVHLEIEHPRLFVVVGSRNVKLPAISRNIGRRLSDSEYLAFLDDDNCWYPDHLERSLAALARTPSAVASYSGLDRVLDDGRRHSSLAVPMDRRLLRNENFVDSNGVVMRRNPAVYWSRATRNRGRFPVEDWELGWRLSKQRRITFTEAVTVRYLLNPGSWYTPEFAEVARREVANGTPHGPAPAAA